MIEQDDAAAPADESPSVGALAIDTHRVRHRDSVASVLEILTQQPGEMPAWIAVCENDRLEGLVATKDLLKADTRGPIAEAGFASITRTDADTTAESAAWLATMDASEVVAVEDESGSYVGIVPLTSFLPVLSHEHEEDIARLGGFLRGAHTARTASEEPVRRRVLHRAPWLLLGLAGAVMAAQIVREFEVELEKTVALAFFLPGIVYMADAVGTQTETLVIRGLSVGIPVRRILRLEVVTGAVVGVLLSLGIFPMALVITGDATLSLAVALSLMASSTVATLVAMSLPWVMDHLGADPAFGSGPLATVIQDLLSILIYFGVAVALIG